MLLVTDLFIYLFICLIKRCTRCSAVRVRIALRASPSAHQHRASQSDPDRASHSKILPIALSSPASRIALDQGDIQEAPKRHTRGTKGAPRRPLGCTCPRSDLNNFAVSNFPTFPRGKVRVLKRSDGSRDPQVSNFHMFSQAKNAKRPIGVSRG